MADLNYPDNVDKIKNFVTRPRKEIEDIDGRGHFTISPLGFPNVNVSGDANPTLITPNFSATYKDAKIFHYAFANAQGGTKNTITLDPSADPLDNIYRDGIIKIISGPGTGQYRTIIAYDGLTKIATVNYDWVTIPDNTSWFSILINIEQEEIGVLRNNFAQPFPPSSSVIILDPDASSTDDFYNTNTIKIISGLGIGQSRSIIDYVGFSKEATVDVPWSPEPNSDSVFIILVRENSVQSSTSSDITLDIGSNPNTGAYDGFIIRIIEGLGIGQERLITNYNGPGTVAEIDRDWVTIPDASSKFLILKNIKYVWDGTENDNKVGTYPNDPITGKEINHLRKTYSDAEVANYLKTVLEPALIMGRNGNGTLFRWLTGRGKENIGSGASGNSIIVDGFGAVPITDTPILSIDEVSQLKKQKRLEILKKRRELRRHKRHTNWLIPNTHEQGIPKYAALKDYPNTYNSEYIHERVGTLIGATNTSVTLSLLSPLVPNDAYNNYIIKITSGPGKGQSATILDYIDTGLVLLSEYWEDLPDNTSQFEIDKIQQGAYTLPVPPSTPTSPDDYAISNNGSGALQTFNQLLRPFMVNSRYYHSDNAFHNNITLDMSDTTMYGRHHISMLHTFSKNVENDGTHISQYMAGNTQFEAKKITITQLDLIDPRILRKETDGPVVRYLYKRRLKGSITDFADFSLAQTPSLTGVQFQKDFPNIGDVTIHLDPNSNTLDITFSAQQSALTVLGALQTNHDMIPGVIDPLDLTYNLETLYVHNTIIDLDDALIYGQAKTRSKKTFVHLPTEGVHDGAICELDVSLPQQKTSDDWFHNTVGVLSGFKNYITQPRVYVFSGYNLKICNDCNLSVDLTEKKNPYLFSSNPEVEYASSGDDFSLTEIIDENDDILNENDTGPGDDIGDENGPGNDVDDENDDIDDENDNTNDIIDENAANDIIDPQGANVFHQRKMEKFDIFGNKYIRKLVFLSSNYVLAIKEDIGKTILGTISGDTAILLNFNNACRTWIIRLVDNSEFNISEPISIIGSSVPFDIEDEIDDIDDENDTDPGDDIIDEGDPSEDIQDENDDIDDENDTNDDDDIIDENGNLVFGTSSGAIVTPKFQDKRVLIATVYPNTTNTFGWRMDNDPSLRLMHWSILANSQFEDGVIHKAYKRNKKVIEDISLTYPTYAGNFDFSVKDFSLSYKNDLLSTDDFSQYVSAHVRLLHPPKLIPIIDADFISDVDLTYALHGNQCNKAFNELLHDFYKSRVRLNVRSDMTTLDSEIQYIGFNNNTRVSPVLISDNYSSGFMQFINTISQYNGNDNAQRWMTKPKDLPLYVVQAGITGEPSRNVFEPPSNDFFTYLSDYFVDSIMVYGDKAWQTEADNRYIIGSNLYPKPSLFRDFAFGSGPLDESNLIGVSDEDHNHIIKRIKKSNGIPAGMIEDIRRRLWESSFDIPYGDNNHPGHNRKFNLFDFRSDLPNDDKYYSKFYGMLWSPFSRIFDMSSTIPKEHTIDGIENLSTITGNGSYDPVQRTLINYIESNPIAERYYRLNHQTSDGSIYNVNNRELSMVVGIHDKLTDITIPDFFNNSKDTFMHNYVSPHSNKLANRFYNSYRMILSGDETIPNNIENVEHFDTTRTFKTMAFSYLNNIIASPNDVDKIAIDDDYLLKHINSSPIKAEDFNMSWTYFDSGKGKLTSIGGVGTNTSNTIILNLSASNIFDYYKDNIIKITSGPLAETYRTIIAYNGSTKVATVDSDWDETNPLNVPVTGNTFTINTQVSALINTSGEQFVFRKGFYDAKGDRSYIRMKMKFIYSSKMGRWVTLDYRQTPTTYLTPTFGNIALSKKEKTTVFPGTKGNITEDYIPFMIPDGVGGEINTIDSLTTPYPWNSNTSSQYKDFLWQNSDAVCQTQTPENTPYHKMKPMKLNRFCIPFLSNKLPYDNNGLLKSTSSTPPVSQGLEDFLSGNHDVNAPEYSDYTLNKLLQPSYGIDFIVPNNSTGGKENPDNSLLLFQPHMFKVYWHIRPAVSAYKGTDIPFSKITNIYSSTAPSATSNTINLGLGASGIYGFYTNTVIFINSGLGIGQYRKILTYDGLTRIATIDRDWDINPDDGFSQFIIRTNARIGGQISDPCLANMFNFPKLSQSPPEFGAFDGNGRIPWHSNMALNWLDDNLNPPPIILIDDIIDENDAEDTDIIIDENDLTCVDDDIIIIEP